MVRHVPPISEHSLGLRGAVALILGATGLFAAVVWWAA